MNWILDRKLILPKYLSGSVLIEIIKSPVVENPTARYLNLTKSYKYGILSIHIGKKVLACQFSIEHVGFRYCCKGPMNKPTAKLPLI